jgi:hypothetical protein
MTEDTEKVEVPLALRQDMMKAIDMFLELAKTEESVRKFLKAIERKINKGLEKKG